MLREIASAVPDNVRVLEGAMTRVMAFASLHSEPLTTPIVHRALGRERRRCASALGRAADPRGDPGRRLRGLRPATRGAALVHDALARIARPRQIAMYLARELTPLSLAEIARGFDRDHSTVLHAVRSVSGRLEPGSETAATIHRIHLTLGTRPTAPDPSTESGHDPLRPGP